MTSGFYSLIEYLSANVGVSTEIAIMICLLLPCILFFAANFKVGMVSTISVTAGLFIFFLTYGYQYDIVLIILLMEIVILSFTLYFIKTESVRGMV